MILGMVMLVLVVKKLLRKWILKSKQRPIKENLEFKKARDPQKNTPESKSARMEMAATPGRFLPAKVTEKNHTFLTLNKELTDRDRSGLMSFVQENNLKLDTMGGAEDEDPGRLDFEIESDFRGQYLDTTSAKQSTKNASAKQFFIEYRSKTNGIDEAASPKLRMSADQIAEVDENEPNVEYEADEPDQVTPPAQPSPRSPTN